LGSYSFCRCLSDQTAFESFNGGAGGRQKTAAGGGCQAVFWHLHHIFLAGAAGSVIFVGWSSFVPLFLAAPLALIQIYFDSARQSRRLAPELAGAVAISSSAAVIALAAGWRAELAVSLWIIMICRSVPSIFYVRERLLLEKRKAYSYYPPVICPLPLFLPRQF
jgi:hypothetical protein